MEEKQIVKNIKQFRVNKKMSIEQLAKLCGLTKGYVSKIENSDKAPPFTTLIKIANALNTDISLLIADDSEIPENMNLCIVREDERKEVISMETLYGYHYEALAHKKIGKNMEPYIIFPAFHEKGVFSHEGEEFMYVLEGTHEFIYDGKKYVLNSGDSIYFDSIIPHSGRSLGKKKAKVLTVTYSYKRPPPRYESIPTFPPRSGVGTTVVPALIHTPLWSGGEPTPQGSGGVRRLKVSKLETMKFDKDQEE